jgi:putative DNA primase/helicase
MKRDYSKIPPELLQLARWVIYRPVPSDKDSGKIRKIPLQSKDPQKGASSTNADHWSTFEEAIQADHDRVGLVIRPPYIGVDLDGVRDPETGSVDPAAEQIIRELNTYTELSPSGKGFHIWLRGKAPKDVRDPLGQKLLSVHKEKLEIYPIDRYFTMTGEWVEGTPLGVRQLEDSEVVKLYSRSGEREIEKAELGTQPPTSETKGYTRLQRFHLLSLGKWQELSTSQSEADLEYCCFLAEAHHGDAKLVDADFRSSKLMRPKWDHMRGADTYGNNTVAEACKRYVLNPPRKEKVVVDPNKWRELFKNPSERDLTPLRWIFKDFMQEQGSMLYGGLSGHGKTLLLMSTAKALVQGTRLFGYFDCVLPGPVLYMIPEAGERSFVRRLEAFRLEKLPGDSFLYRTMSQGLTIPLDDARVLKAVEGRHVFLDTAIRFQQGDENSASDNDTGLAAGIFKILQAGALSVWGAHHSGKGFESATHMSLENVLRGTGDIGAMLSTAYGVRQIDKVKNLLYIDCVKPRDFEPKGPFQLEGRPWIDTEGDFRMVTRPGETPSMEEVITQTKMMKDSPARAEAIAMYNSQLTIPAIVKELVNKGYKCNYKTVQGWVKEEKTPPTVIDFQDPNTF